MLTAIFLILSAAAAVGLSLAAQSLWVLPLGFAGCFLLLAALWFLMILVMAKQVDMDAEQGDEAPFFRWVIRLTVAALIPLLGVRVRTRGLEQTPKSGRFLLVCNHLHDVDPAFLLRYFPDSQLAFIAKQEVKQMFLVGPFLKKTLGQFVNRENDREALKAILNCIRIIKEDEASVAVFPEGYVSLNRKLHPFRPGVFKIAQKAQVPIVVCTLQDTHKVMPNVKRLKRSCVQLHLVGVIPAEQLQGVTTVDIAHRVHAMMAQDLGPELVEQEENT